MNVTNNARVLLQQLIARVSGDIEASVSKNELTELAMSHGGVDDLDPAYRYLKAKGLIRINASGMVGITVQGIDEMLGGFPTIPAVRSGDAAFVVID